MCASRGCWFSVRKRGGGRWRLLCYRCELARAHANMKKTGRRAAPRKESIMPGIKTSVDVVFEGEQAGALRVLAEAIGREPQYAALGVTILPVQVARLAVNRLLSMEPSEVVAELTGKRANPPGDSGGPMATPAPAAPPAAAPAPVTAPKKALPSSGVAVPRDDMDGLDIDDDGSVWGEKAGLATGLDPTVPGKAFTLPRVIRLAKDLGIPAPPSQADVEAYYTEAGWFRVIFIQMQQNVTGTKQVEHHMFWHPSSNIQLATDVFEPPESADYTISVEDSGMEGMGITHMVRPKGAA
jgi:hypothetical protein